MKVGVDPLTGLPNLSNPDIHVVGGGRVGVNDGESGGGGAVDSVNGETGVVVLDQDDIGDGTTYKQYSQTEKTKLSGIEANADVTDATNVGAAGAFMKSVDDLDDISDGSTNKAFTSSEKTKLSGIETAADVTDATNVTAAGAVMTTGNQTITGNKTFSYPNTIPTTDNNFVIESHGFNPLRVIDKRTPAANAGTGPAFGSDGGTITSGARLMYFLAFGSDGTAARNAASFEAFATGNWSNGVYPVKWVFSASDGTGARVERLSVGGDGVIINDTGVDKDFRVEGDTKDHMVFVDASAATENIALLASSAPNWQSMDGGLFVANADTIPTGNPSGGGFLFVDSGALKFHGPSGTVTTIAPA